MPSMRRAGSPGTTCNTANTTTDASTRVAAAMARRLRKYPVMGGSVPSRASGQGRVSAKPERSQRSGLPSPLWRPPTLPETGRGRPWLVVPLHFREVIGLDGRILPQAGKLRIPHAYLGQFEQESHHRIIGKNVLGLGEQTVACGLVGGQVELLYDLVEFWILVIEVVFRPRINVDV